MEFQSLHEKISDVAVKLSGKTAVEWGERKISFIELEEKANQIANVLYPKISENKNVPIILENSIELVEVLLGCMKCGAVFVPLDPGFPENRIKVMMEEVGADWVITRSVWLDKLERMLTGETRKINALVLDMPLEGSAVTIAAAEAAMIASSESLDLANNQMVEKKGAEDEVAVSTNLATETIPTQYQHINVFPFDQTVSKECQFPTDTPSRHCYIYFTSGSTGKPKAILGRHKSLKHFIDWEIAEFGIDETCRVSQLVTPSFDAILRDIFVPLCAGATLCIPESREIVLTPKRLKAWIDESRITLTHMVPTLFKVLMTEVEDANCFKNLKYILLAGEMLRGNDIKKFFQLFEERIQLVNLYGATETTLVKLFYRVKASDVDRVSVPVGKPMAGAQVMILNSDMQPCAPGSIGEIYIRTPFTSEGYYKDSESTRAVFIKNPFNDNPRDIIYKTGDLGMMLTSGDIEVLGRVDHQVKLRGVRIELGEIENQLLQHDSITEAIAIARDDEEGNKYLCAYFVAKAQLTSSELREYLAKHLPEYMMPTYFLQLEQMPLTPNGKTDRKALPEPEAMLGPSVQYVPPETAVEETLIAIWSEVLGKEGIGVNHNFFDLGGHSLKAATIVAKIHKELNVEVPLKEIFINPTIKQLASYISKADKNIYSSIKKVEEKEYYPVSSAQKRVYVLNQLEKTVISYNMPRVLTINGALNREKLEQSVKTLIQRHEALRTSFHSIDGEIVQKVHAEVDFTLTYIEANEKEVSQIVQQFIQPFNLEKAPLLRVGLVKVGTDQHVMLFDTHHIVSDGTSMDILVRDFVSLYEGKELPELSIQYKDYSEWQNELLTSGEMDIQEKYWLNVFAGSLPLLNMPTDYPRPSQQSFEGSRVHFEADSQLTEQLNALAKANGTTLYMVLLAAYNVLLSKYSGQEDIVVGSPIAGRPHVDLQNIIGMFINTLAMRNYPQHNKTFKEFLHEIKENALKAYEHQEYQFEHLVKKLNIARDLSRNPLFDTMFVLHNNEHAQLVVEGLTFGYYPFENTVSKLDMTLNAEEWNNRIGFNLEYCTKLFKRETMERLMAHYISILKEVVSNPDKHLADVDMILLDEKQKILSEFNNTKVDYPANKTIHELFEEQVEKTPDNIALVFADKQLTYRELNSKANQLAKMLRAKGVKAETITAIMIERSLEMMIGIFAILKAGGAYLPIDPDYPAERIKYVLEDSGAKVILTQDKFFDTLSMLEVEVIRIDEDAVYQGESSNLEPIDGADNLAYVIYTSGSTGKPKGVMIEHRAVNNFIKGITDQIEFTAEKSILALTTISFDIFGLETLLPLTQGTRVVIANEEQQKDTKALYRVMKKNSIDMLQMTPSRMRMLLSDDQSVPCLKNVKDLMIGGEAFPQVLLAEVKQVTNARIYNMYGPTETTIWSAVKDLTDVKEITIGRPIANTGMFIIGALNQLQPIGVPGELSISGDGLARGYLNRPELTAEQFISNPFSSEKTLLVNGARMYRTGDLARWLPTGEIECLGRIDHQVKIRGYRIELGEIESQLMNHETVKEAVVVSKEDGSGGKYLCAYVVGEGEISIPDLKVHLTKVLPDYMIPTFFIPLESMLYTPNGKIDRKALPEPDAGMVSGVEYVAPSNEIEEKLVQVWEEVLGIEGIGINHNFFDVGGNSINIIKVISLISVKFGVTLTMSELFMRPTIAEIANNLFLENPLKGLECMISLNKPTEGKRNVFIIHNWEGIVYQYKEFAKQLEGEYNIYGIQAKGVIQSAPLPKTTEEMLTEYICEIKAVQPEGPYLIGGYCYGNWLAYKMVEMLEDQGVPVEKMIMIDENAWLSEKLVEHLTFKTAITKPKRVARKIIRKIIKRNANPMDYWPTIEEYREMNPTPEFFTNEMTVRDNVNHLCTKMYRLNHFISTDTYIIKAEENNLPRYTPEAWKKICYGKIWFKEIPGGHETIFNYPYVDGLTNALRQVLED